MDNIYVNSTYEVSTNSFMCVGGIVGYGSGTIRNCGINSGSLTVTKTKTTGNIEIGGIIGRSTGTIENCYNKANINGTNTCTSNNEIHLGGIVAFGYPNIKNCYNTGNLTGKGYILAVGGIIGQIYKSSATNIINSYSIGTASATGTTAWAAGIVARNGWSTSAPKVTVTNSYCKDNVTYSQYYWNGSSTSTSTAERRNETTLKSYVTTLGDEYVADTKNINNGYPILKWQVEN